jgi:transposase
MKTKEIVQKIIKLLGMFMSKTLAKRLVSMVLLSVEVPEERVTELTEVCNRSVRGLKKDLKNGKIEELFTVGGGGRKAILKDVEIAVIGEIAENNYHSQQQIADMVWEKYGLKISKSTVRNLLKKTESND